MIRELDRHEPETPARIAAHQVVIPEAMADAGEGASRRIFEFYTVDGGENGRHIGGGEDAAHPSPDRRGPEGKSQGWPAFAASPNRRA